MGSCDIYCNPVILVWVLESIIILDTSYSYPTSPYFQLNVHPDRPPLDTSLKDVVSIFYQESNLTVRGVHHQRLEELVEIIILIFIHQQPLLGNLTSHFCFQYSKLVGLNKPIQ